MGEGTGYLGLEVLFEIAVEILMPTHCVDVDDLVLSVDFVGEKI